MWFAEQLAHSVGGLSRLFPDVSLHESPAFFILWTSSLPSTGCWAGYGHQFTAQKYTYLQPFLENSSPFIFPPPTPVSPLCPLFLLFLISFQFLYFYYTYCFAFCSIFHIRSFIKCLVTVAPVTSGLAMLFALAKEM